MKLRKTVIKIEGEGRYRFSQRDCRYTTLYMMNEDDPRNNYAMLHINPSNKDTYMS